MRFDFVIFDLDGTIYDSLPVAMSALLICRPGRACRGMLR